MEKYEQSHSPVLLYISCESNVVFLLIWGRWRVINLIKIMQYNYFIIFQSKYKKQLSLKCCSGNLCGLNDQLYMYCLVSIMSKIVKTIFILCVFIRRDQVIWKRILECIGVYALKSNQNIFTIFIWRHIIIRKHISRF